MTENGPRADESSNTTGAFDDVIFRSLASRERRRVLSILLDGEQRGSEELATLLLGWDATASGSVGDPEEHRRTVLRLRHSLLPKLDDAGLVDHDPDRGTVRLASLDPHTVELIERSVDTA